MTERPNQEVLLQRVRTYGADLSRWAEGDVTAAREALLAEPEFRRAYEDERTLDLAIGRAREQLDRDARLAGAAERIRHGVLSQVPVNVLAGIEWRRIAAAVLVAVMLGGATDLFLADPVADSPELVMLDPLASSDASLQ